MDNSFPKIPQSKKHETDQKLYLITKNTVTLPPYHISIAPLKAINYAISTYIKPNSLIYVQENTFFSIEQPDLVIIPMLQKLGTRIPDVYITVLWNPGGQTVILKRSMTISSIEESDYI